MMIVERAAKRIKSSKKSKKRLIAFFVVFPFFATQSLPTIERLIETDGFSNIFSIAIGLSASGQSNTEQKKLDPKAWGGNHVGKPVPEYVQGDECLFCHRNDIGPTWQKNAHGLTVRQREDAPVLAKMLEEQPALAGVAKQVEYFLGSRHRVRFLKKEGYGKFAILNAQGLLAENGQGAKLLDAEKPAWDKERFANRCAGCHATAVDAATRTFAGFGLEC
jgi:hypothetical protein